MWKPEDMACHEIFKRVETMAIFCAIADHMNYSHYTDNDRLKIARQILRINPQTSVNMRKT